MIHGTGAGPEPTPTLTSTMPLTGEMLILTVESSAPFAYGRVFRSLATAEPTMIGQLGFVYLDLPTTSEFITFFTDGNGDWSTALISPMAGCTCSHYMLQGVIEAPPSETWPYPWQLTNGLELQAGVTSP